jgi:hypothetical protein
VMFVCCRRRKLADIDAWRPISLARCLRRPRGMSSLDYRRFDAADQALPLPISISTLIRNRPPDSNSASLRLARECLGTRLITIAGPGGIGKTSVALAVAEGSLAAYEDGVCLGASRADCQFKRQKTDAAARQLRARDRGGCFFGDKDPQGCTGGAYPRDQPRAASGRGRARLPALAPAEPCRAG